MRKKTALSIALTTSLVVPAVLANAPVVQAVEAPKYIDVQFLGINDFHGNIDTESKMKDASGKEVKVGGAAYLATHLKQREQEVANKGGHTFRVHAGDIVGASPSVSSLLQDEPTMEILDKMKFDVGALGNHEFDEGIPELKRLYSGGEHPKVKEYTKGTNYTYNGIRNDFNNLAANVTDKKTGQPIFNPYVVKEVEGVKIGFIGVVTKETPTVVMPEFVKDYNFIDEAEAINKYTKELKDQGVKAIVVLGHVDATTKGDTTTGTFADIAMKVDDEVDMFFTGHNHGYVNGYVDGKLLVQSYDYGKAFSDVDTKLDPTTKDFVKGETKAQIVLNTRDVEPNAEIKAIVDEAKEITKTVTEKEIAKATSSNPIGERKPEGGENAVGNLVVDAQRIMSGADFAITNSGGVREALKPSKNAKGEDIFTWGSAYAVQPFGNQVKVVSMTGQQIKDALNQQWQDPNRDMFLQISGFKYTYERTDKGTKVVDMFLADGSKMDMNKAYTVAANEFLVGGGDKFTAFKGSKLVRGYKTDTETFTEYIEKLGKEGKPVTAAVEGRAMNVKDVPVKPDPSKPTTGGETTKPEQPTTGDKGTNNSTTGTTVEGTKDTTATNETKETAKTKDGEELPNTATNMYSMMAAGLAALLAGTVVFFRRRKQQQ
jgi:5'-nucleotidase